MEEILSGHLDHLIKPGDCQLVLPHNRLRGLYLCVDIDLPVYFRQVLYSSFILFPCFSVTFNSNTLLALFA